MHSVVTGGVTPALEVWLDASALPTPYLVVDIDEVLRQYDRLAAGLGIDLFSFDCADELHKRAVVAQLLPAGRALRVMCRVLVDTSGSDWPLGAKFGCEPEMAVQLLVDAQRRGLAPRGVAFRVGSQQREPARWTEAIGMVAEIYRAVAAYGIAMPAIDIGGGLPAHYGEPVPTVRSSSRARPATPPTSATSASATSCR